MLSRKWIDDEAARCSACVTASDPGSARHALAAQALLDLNLLAAMARKPDAADEAERPPAAGQDQPKGPDDEPKSSDVRSRIARLRRSVDINIAAIIKELGADSFTTLPPALYPELLSRAEAEAERLSRE